MESNLQTTTTQSIQKKGLEETQLRIFSSLYETSNLSKTNRDIVIASSKINTDNTFRGVVAKIHVLYSVTIPDKNSWALIDLCESFYYENYKNVNLSEFELAFILNLTNKLNADTVECFNLFDVKFMTKILNLYLNTRKLAMLELFKAEIIGSEQDIKNSTITDSEREKMDKELLLEIHHDKIAYRIAKECFIADEFVLTSVNSKYLLLEKIGIINLTLQQKIDRFNSCALTVKKQVKQKKLKEKVGVQAIENYLSEYFDIVHKNEVVYECRRVEIIKYFNKDL